MSDTIEVVVITGGDPTMPVALNITAPDPNTPVQLDVTTPGPQGPPGTDGTDGINGAAATITVGTTTTGAPGTDAEVVNVGTDLDAIFNFTIPQGLPGVGFNEPVADGFIYGRDGGAQNWQRVLRLTGDVMTGPLTLAGNATQPMQPATLSQLNAVQSQLGNYLPLIGGTLTGTLMIDMPAENGPGGYGNNLVLDSVNHYGGLFFTSGAGTDYFGIEQWNGLRFDYWNTAGVQTAIAFFNTTVAQFMRPVQLPGNATQGLQAVPLQQLQQTAALYLPLTGGTLTGPLTLAANAAGPLQPVTLQQMNAGLALYLPLTGGTVTGLITVIPPTSNWGSGYNMGITLGSLTTSSPGILFVSNSPLQQALAIERYSDSLWISYGTATAWAGDIVRFSPTVAAFYQNVSVVNSKTLTVSGATILQSTLSVAGTTQLGSTLNVTGATTLSSTLHTVGTGQFDADVTVGTGAQSVLLDITGLIELTSTGWPVLRGNTVSTGTAALLIDSQRNGATRWSMQLGTTEPETGGNAGSNFYLSCAADNGSPLYTVLIIQRVNGLALVVGDPVQPLGIATKQYVDNTRPVPSNLLPIMDSIAFAGVNTDYSRSDHVHPSDTTRLTQAQGDARYLQLTGGVMTGELQVLAPVQPQDAAPKSYVDNINPAGKYVLITGDTMEGQLLMGGYVLSDLAWPNNNLDAVPKEYVDTVVNSQSLWQGVYNADTNTPDLSTIYKENEYSWTANTASSTGMTPLLVDLLPGMPAGTIIDRGSQIIWSTVENEWFQVYGSSITREEADLLYVEKTGDTMTGPLTMANQGIAFGGPVGANPSDFQNQISLYPGWAGISVTSNRLNVVSGLSGAGGTWFVVNNSDQMAILGSGIYTYAPLILGENATQPMQAVTLQQLNADLSGFLPLTGGTMTGTLTLANDVRVAWNDASGGSMRMFVQSDNNFIWVGTDASGADRIIAAMYMHNSGSYFTFYPTVQFNAGAIIAGNNLSFGNRVVASPQDLSQHINLYGDSYGFAITSNTLNYNSTSDHRFWSGATLDFWITNNEVAAYLPVVINAYTPSWGAFNFGQQLLIQGVQNNSIGIADSSDQNYVAINNSGGTLGFFKMPLPTDSTTPPIPLLQMNTTSATFSYPVVLPGNATQPLQATPLQQVQSLLAGYLPLSGGTMTGPLYLARDPQTPTEAATKNYIDTQISYVEGHYLPLTGGNLSGKLSIQVAPTATSAQLELTPGGGALGLQSKIRFDGTFHDGTTDLGARLVASIRAGFSAGAWGGEYLDVWVNNGGMNDAASDANQAQIMRFANSGITAYVPVTLPANAATNLQAVPLQQVNSLLTGYLPLTGGTLTGGVFGPQFTGTSSGGGAAAAFRAQASGNATYMWYETGAGTDAKKWDAIAGGGNLYFRILNDAESTSFNWLVANRSGAAMSSVIIAAPVTYLNDGKLSFNSAVAGTPTDLSHGIDFFGGTYGFAVSSGRLNYNGDANAQHVFLVGGVDQLRINGTGAEFFNSLQVDGAILTTANIAGISNGGQIGTIIANNLSQGAGETDFINLYTGYGGFRWYQATGATTTKQLMSLAPDGILTLSSVGVIYTLGGTTTNVMGFTWGGGNVNAYVDGNNVGALATQGWVNSQVGAYLPLTGGNLNGSLSLKYLTAQTFSPNFSMQSTGNGTDQNIWDMYVASGGSLHFRTVNDAYTAANDWLVVSRNGYSANNIAFAGGNVYFNNPMLQLGLGGQGQIGLYSGGGAPGYLAIFNPSGTRVGYVGFNDGNNYLCLQTESGWSGWHINGSLVIDGNIQMNGGVVDNLVAANPAGGWSSANVGKQLLISCGPWPNFNHPAMAITDAAGNNYWGIVNINGDLYFSVMPPYSDNTTALIDSLVISRSTGQVWLPGTAAAAPLLVDNGDQKAGNTGRVQIRFGYSQTGGQYAHWIATRHDSFPSPTYDYGNAIDFYLCDGTAAGTYPTNAFWGGSFSSCGLSLPYGTQVNPSLNFGNNKMGGAISKGIFYNGSDACVVANPTTALGIATKQYVDAGVGGGLPLTGGVLTGNVAISTPTNPALVLNSPSGQQNLLVGNRGGTATTGFARWVIVLGDSTPETGGNVGSDFEIYRYSDTGVWIDSPLHITRSNGAVYVTNRFNVQNSALDVSGGATTIANLTVGSGGLWVNGQTDVFSGTFHGSFSLTGGSNFIPTNNSCSCGYGGQAWQQVMSYSFPNASDPRDKKHIARAPAGALDEVNRVPVVRYRWKVDQDDAPIHTGFLATDVADVLGYDRAAVVVGEDENKSLALNLMDMIATLWQATQELSAQNVALMARMETMERRTIH